ncbi:EF-hand calcium-binding domain-containing protein 4B, partial [Cichlidogyrus casuarinus]
MNELENMQAETSNEKQSLSRERDLLHSRLLQSEADLKDCQDQIEQLRVRAREDRKIRARAVIDMNEGIAIEREGLVKQVEYLRNINRQLKDEHDERMNSQLLYDVRTGGETLGSLDSRQNSQFLPPNTADPDYNR